MSVRPTMVAGALAVVVFAGACGGSGDGNGPSANACEGYRFDRAAWRAPTSSRGTVETPSRRSELAEALIECGALQGRSRDDVRRILGKPYWTVDDEWYFDLGPDRRAGLDREHLLVRFDRSGRASRTAIVTL